MSNSWRERGDKAVDVTTMAYFAPRVMKERSNNLMGRMARTGEIV